MRRVPWAVAVVLAPCSASACELREPFRMDRISAAELVVVGRVTGFDLTEEGFGFALVTVAVEEVLKGRAGAEVTFGWNGGMAQGPSADVAQGQVLIAAMKGGRIAVTSLVADKRPDLPSIIQPYCGEVWMQKALPEVVKAAREALE